MREELVDKLVGNIYRAAAGDVPWNEPVDELAHLFNAWGAHLLGVRHADGGMMMNHEGGRGMTPEGALEYMTKWNRIDPRAAVAVSNPLLGWMNCHEHFDEAFVDKDPFFQGFLLPYGGRYFSGSKVYQDDEVAMVMGIQRGRGSQPLNAEEVAIGQRIGRHFQTALGLWRRTRQRQQEGAIGRALLERMTQPVLLVDEQPRLHFCNAAARRILDERRRVTERSGMLVCADAAKQAELLLALRRLGIGSHQSTEDRLALRLGSSGETRSLLLLLSRMLPAESMGAFGPRSFALVLLHELDHRAAPDPYLISVAYSLTPGEAQVAARVAQGHSLQSIAEDHCTSIHTVRSQLATAFQKVGVNRQSGLASALATLPSIGA